MMNVEGKTYTEMFRSVKIATAATVDEFNKPQARIINVMIANEDGMYIVTSKGKPFYKQLMETGEIALSAMCPNNKSLKFTGKCRLVDKFWVDEVFVQNPGMNEVYPEDSRYILDAFLIYSGQGEFFDLDTYPIQRTYFSYGEVQREEVGFYIDEQCTKCNVCVKKCPQKCISTGDTYKIKEENCLFCGLCLEVCPVDAIKAKHRVFQ
ncbi:MAG: 4Fe-4S binding protein [Eubacteriales bacterium]